MTPETTGCEFTHFSETASEQGTCFSKMSTDNDVGKSGTSNSEKLGRLGSAQQSSPGLSFLIVKNDMGEKRLFVDLGTWNWPLSVRRSCVLLWGTAPCPLVTRLGSSPPVLPLGESRVTSRMGSVSSGAGALGGFWAEISERAWGTHRQAGRRSGGGWLWPAPALKCSQGHSWVSSLQHWWQV